MSDDFFTLLQNLQDGERVVIAFPFPSELVTMVAAMLVAVVLVYLIKWVASWLTG